MQVSETLSITRPSRPPVAAHAPRSADRFHLTGPSVVLDPRVNAVRRDIADIGLADRVFAPHYAAPEYCACALSSVMLRESADDEAVAVSQLACGETFAVVDVSGGWAWGYGLHDRYVGYLRTEALGPMAAATHVVTAASAPLFAHPDIKAAVLGHRTIGTRIVGTSVGEFVSVEGGFFHRRHVAPAEERAADPVSVAERLVGLPYLWGGRGDGGIDCSGLVQRVLGLCGIAVPRDSDQQRAIGEEIAVDAPMRRGDIVLFPGHVGLMVDETRLIHANAHWMAVTVEPLQTVVARGAEIVARRRIAWA